MEYIIAGACVLVGILIWVGGQLKDEADFKRIHRKDLE